MSTSSNQTEVLSKEATVALSVVGAILFLCIVLGFAFFCFIRHQQKQIAEYRSQFFLYTGKHQVKHHVNEVNLKPLHNNQDGGYCNLLGWEWCFLNCVKFTPLPPLSKLEGFQDRSYSTTAMTTLNEKKRGRGDSFRENFVSDGSDQIRKQVLPAPPVVAILGSLSKHEGENKMNLRSFKLHLDKLHLLWYVKHRWLYME